MGLPLTKVETDTPSAAIRTVARQAIGVVALLELLEFGQAGSGNVYLTITTPDPPAPAKVDSGSVPPPP